MEPEADDAPERVRILSTLAASRPPSKRASARSRRKRGNSWQFKALLALMGLGIVGLLAGFAMVLAQGHAQAGAAVPQEPARRALLAAPSDTAKPPTVMATGTASPSASAADLPIAPAPQTAVIEEVAPTAVASLATVAAASPLAALGATPPAPSATPTSTTQSTPAALLPSPAKAPTPATVRDEPRRVAKAAPAEVRPRQNATKRGQDADVALLEAMFTHTRAGGTDSERRRRCAQQPKGAGCAPSR
jgi:hypothetical protein